MPTFTSHDGTERAYRRAGKGPLLVCLPGGPTGASACLGDLSDQGGGLAAHRTLVLLDPRGAEDTAAPADPATCRHDHQVADIEALRVHLGLDRLDVLAHFASGKPALLHAARHPDRVGSLALIAPGVRDTDPEVTEAAGDDAAGDDADGAFGPAAAKDALAQVSAPVLILAGAYDGGPPPARAAALADLLPNAELAVLRGRGGHPWLDDPQAFVRTVVAFLDPDVATVRHTVNTEDGHGVRLAYRVRGPRSAPPVVLVHGRGGDSRDWDEIAGQLAATRRVYALDLRGHGLSDWPGGYSFEAFRDDLSGFITELGLAGTDVVAHSMGGAAAALLAQEAPHLVGRLVLEEVPPLLPLNPRRGPVERPEGRLDFDWPVVPAINAQLNDPDPAWHRRFGTLSTPALLIAGGPSSHVDQTALTALAGLIPDARLARFDTGHLVHSTDPAGFLAALRGFGI
ncbi:alpha/beta fold hydrolase [Streptomyces sp. NPDC048416]|uniref:alpha/beta fold hydrolase n=1 Tax=Streptomyces sp. NPDC048416 TaxID=3365546 RepID=UPI00371E945E